jgi:hypothetical protein
MRFYNTDEIRKVAKGHFFDKDSMRFFDSRVCLDAFDGPGGCFFVTSERFRGPCGGKVIPCSRRFTVRRFNRKTGAVTTPGTFQGYASRTGALAAAKRASEDASPRSAAAWKAARTREDNRRRAEAEASHQRWLAHVAPIRAREIEEDRQRKIERYPELAAE